jgi:hypothetical protein
LSKDMRTLHTVAVKIASYLAVALACRNSAVALEKAKVSAPPTPTDADSLRVYFRAMLNAEKANETKYSFPTAVVTFDEVGRMLGELHPRHFDVAEPNGLGRAVAEIVKDIEASTSVSAGR